MIITNAPVAGESSIKNKHFRKAKLQKAILRKFYRDGFLSIHELSESIKMSAPTITKAVDDLIEEQLVVKTGMGESSGGRRPWIFGINPSSRYILAVDLERSFVRMAIFDFLNQPVSGIRVFNEGLDTLDDSLQFITERIDELLHAYDIPKDRVLGIGLSLPGLIDIHTGLSHTYLVDRKPVSDKLWKLTGIPTYVEHDTKAMALGEQAFGLAVGLKNVLCLNIGSGIGLSMILNGEIYKGQSGYSGEFGHIQIDNNGELCHCGKRGCIETKAAGKSLIGMVRNDIAKGIDTGFEPASKITLPLLLETASMGNPYILQLLEQSGVALGKGLAVLIHLFNPELIILGGEISKASAFILKPIVENIEYHTIEKIREDTRIVTSELGDNARIMGSLALVMKKVFA